MSYSQWANFVYYKLNDIAIYNTVTYQALQANVNVIPTTLAPNWVVLPVAGAGVSSLNALTGALSLVAGSNMTVTPAGSNITLNAKNFPITERTSSTTATVITATTFGTAQSLLTLTITPTFVSDIDIFATMSFVMASNTIHDLIFYITIGGVQVGGTFRASGSGVGHFLNTAIQATALAQVATIHTIVLRVYASVASQFTVSALQMSAIANLV